MYKNKKISVVIPCYNEGKTIGVILKNMPDFIDETIVIDNNSTDKTSEIVRKFKNVLLEKESIQGYGATIKKGIIKSQGEIVAIMDGDNQHLIKDIMRLIDFLIEEKQDFIWGSRFPIKIGEATFSRIFGNKVQTILFNFLFKTKIKDSQSGMVIFRREKLFSNININALSNGMAFSEEIKVNVIFSGLKWNEKKINIKKRKGTSKLNPIYDGIKNISKLFKLYYELKIRKNC
ncbi:glycosyltransferase family 2 protein [bacterium]|nr:MAG: glycosyltransferase family 2 protein [bacterium]